MEPEAARRIEQLERDNAVMQERQTRYEASQQLMMAKLDSIARDVSQTRELIVTSLTGYVTHQALQQRNGEVDQRLARIETRQENSNRWLIGALFGLCVALGMELFKAAAHVA